MAENTMGKMPPLPPAQLGQYRGLSAECKVQPVTDAQVQLALETLRLRAAEKKAVTGPAARGDDVTLDFAGFDAAGRPIPDSAMQNVAVHLGAGKMLPGVEDKICGHCAGETFAMDFTYPQNFRVAALSGSRARFSICLHTVRRRVKPPLNDAFAAAQGCKDMAALEAKLRAERQAMHARMARHAVRSTLLEQAGQNLTVDFPPELLDGLVERKMQILRQDVNARGTTLAQYFKISHQDERTVRAQMRQDAESGMRRRLAVEKIAEAEAITVTQEEIDREYARLAAMQGAEPGQLHGPLTENTVRGALLTEKVCDLLMESAQLTMTEQAEEV